MEPGKLFSLRRPGNHIAQPCVDECFEAALAEIVERIVQTKKVGA